MGIFEITTDSYMEFLGIPTGFYVFESYRNELKKSEWLK